MNTFRKILRLILRIVFLIAVLVLAFWLKTAYIQKTSAPISSPKAQEQIIALENPKEIEFKWQYNNKEYVLKETFYGSLYAFYANSPKTYLHRGELPADWEKDYYAMFLKKNDSDDSIPQIASNIKSLGEQNKLVADQIVELALAFVQSIPYDHVRAQSIISGDGVTNYPYETLYENIGVCSDKSFLLANLLAQLGYDTALLAYNDERHMAVGIKCPAQYSNYPSGYCYAETTANGFRIGMIPDIDAQKGSAVPIEKKNYSQGSELNQFDAKKLGEPKIFPVSSGKIYSGIADSLALAKKIDALRYGINTLEKNLITQKNSFEADEARLSELEKKLEKLKKKDEVKEYNDLVEDYNELLKRYKKKIQIYNEQIDTYNQKINLYNSLVHPTPN